MQSRLFRFEILRALHPTSFAARDLRTSRPVTVLEWTPPATERDAARKRLEALTPQLPGESFSADASLYLALAATDAPRALELLRQHGLFTGTAAETPSQPPPRPPAQPAPPAQAMPAPPLAAPFRAAGAQNALHADASRPVPTTAPRAGRAAPRPARSGTALGLFLVAGVALAVGWSLGSKDAATSQPASSRTDAQQAGNEPAGDRKLHAAPDATLAGVHVLRLRNGCGSPVRAAVVYTGFTGEQVAEGWIAIRPGQTAIVAASPARDFHVFALAADGSHAWGAASGLPIQTESGDFLYRTAAPGDSGERTPHGTFPVRVNGSSEVSSLDCRTPAGTE